MKPPKIGKTERRKLEPKDFAQYVSYVVNSPARTVFVWVVWGLIVLLFAKYTYQFKEFYQKPNLPIESTGRLLPSTVFPKTPYQFEILRTPWWYGKKAKQLDSLNKAGIEYQNKGDINKAIQCFEDGLAKNPKSSYLHNNLGVALMSLVDPKLEAARVELQRAADMEPRDPIPLENELRTYVAPEPRVNQLKNQAFPLETRKEWKEWLREVYGP